MVDYKRKLNDIFPLKYETPLRDQYPSKRETKLSDKFPLPPGGAEYGSGFLNPISIAYAAPVFQIPVPSFTVDYLEYPGLTPQTGTSSNSPPGSSVLSFQKNFTLTNTTDDTTYNSLFWSVTENGVPLTAGIGQTYSIPYIIAKDLTTTTVLYDIHLQASLNGQTPGSAFMRLSVVYPPDAPAILFNNVATTYTEPTPESFASTLDSTTLTFVNSTAASPEWDNVVMTLTIT